MTDTVILYHNTRCSKSRAALTLLQTRGIDAKVVNYLDTPPDFATLQDIFGKLGADSPRVMMRVKDSLYRDLKLDNPALGDNELLAAVAAHPALLERPIVVANGKAAVGRPLENIEAILD